MKRYQQLLTQAKKLLERRRELVQQALSYQLPTGVSRKLEKPEWTAIRLIAIELQFVVDELLATWPHRGLDSRKGAKHDRKARSANHSRKD